MGRLVIFTTFSLLFQIISVATGMELCKSGVQSKVCKNVDKPADYIFTSPPKPNPANVNIDIYLVNVLDIVEDSQIITAQLKIKLTWIDDLLFVNRTQDDIDQ